MTVEKHKSQRSESSNAPVARVVYCYFHKKREKSAAGRELKTPRFDATLLFPKLNPDPAQCANYQYLMKHCMDAAAKAWPGAGWPQGGHWPIQDGDAPLKPKAVLPGQPVVPVDPNKYAWRKGNWIVEVTHVLDPGPRIAVMQNGQITELPAQTINGREMYKSGDYAIVHMHAYTFQNEKFGCNFGFEGVLFVKEGERVGSSGGRTTSQMFGAMGHVGTMPPGVPALPTSAPVASGGAPTMAPVQTVAPAVAVAPAPMAPAGFPSSPPIQPAAPPLPPFPGR